MKLVFASSNINKLDEIRNILSDGYTILSLSDLGHIIELEESDNTLEGNALQKARFVYEKFGINCFADDSGLEVELLNGSPGVHSAYYAGHPRNDQNNIRLLLAELGAATHRKARFRTVIALIHEGKEVLFNGFLNGNIATTPVGENGFGYDSIFIPEKMSQTLAQLSKEEKNGISHRAMAVHQLTAYLASLNS